MARDLAGTGTDIGASVAADCSGISAGIGISGNGGLVGEISSIDSSLLGGSDSANGAGMGRDVTGAGSGIGLSVGADGIADEDGDGGSVAAVSGSSGKGIEI